ncbi:hypothetical protein OH76DRAFT_1479484 [Lentinus brumalis]|uniref:Protein kinase domain-containing protein n=1 Tax=Lentinus brumalis TaxID=2498619 RepID=A0A371DME3_9APHY|nr:hypothetical protein OH76DRAFT_1479484 [Polyporus brumalis]
MSDADLQRFRESFNPPAWLANHAEVTARDMHLVYALKPGQVYCTSPKRFAVKITDASSEEASIYDKLLRLGPASPNHVLPCTVVRSDTQQPFIIMPCLTDLTNAGLWKWNLMSCARSFRQMVEAAEMLHRQKIAHLDIAVNNFVMAKAHHMPHHDSIELGKIYIIDFGVSQHFELGFGRQSSITLPSTQVPKPQGITHLDPFSWDIYCLGFTFQTLLGWVYRDRPQPWMLRRYATWLLGNEQGCTAEDSDHGFELPPTSTNQSVEELERTTHHDWVVRIGGRAGSW